jgi:hypothetical protein
MDQVDPRRSGTMECFLNIAKFRFENRAKSGHEVVGLPKLFVHRLQAHEIVQRTQAKFAGRIFPQGFSRFPGRFFRGGAVSQ